MPWKWSWLLEEAGVRKLLSTSSLLVKYLFGRGNGASEVVKCALCPNMCRHACPVSIVDGRETTSPAGKSRLAMLIERGLLELDQETVKPVYACLSCEACKRWCYFEFSVSELLQRVKSKSVSAGFAPPGALEVLSNLRSYGYAYGRPGRVAPQRGEILYLAGCTVREYLPGLAEKTVKLLEENGWKVAVVDEKCCGVPAYYLGDLELFKEVARTSRETVSESGAETVVTSCPSCTYAMRVLYPRFGVKLSFRVLHITELLSQHLNRFKTSSNKSVKVTYHDPCKLSYSLDEPDLLRNLLVSFGVTVVDPWRRGRETFCCGYGGGLSFSHPQLAKMIAGERVRELSQYAELAVTACPTCKLAFQSNGYNAVDIVELVYDLTR